MKNHESKQIAALQELTTMYETTDYLAVLESAVQNHVISIDFNIMTDEDRQRDIGAFNALIKFFYQLPDTKPKK